MSGELREQIAAARERLDYAQSVVEHDERPVYGAAVAIQAGRDLATAVDTWVAAHADRALPEPTP